MLKYRGGFGPPIFLNIEVRAGLARSTFSLESGAHWRVDRPLAQESLCRKSLGADEAAPSNCRLEGHASSCPKLQVRRRLFYSNNVEVRARHGESSTGLARLFDPPMKEMIRQKRERTRKKD